MLIVYLPVLVAILGLILFVVTQGKASTAGLWMFGAGLLVFLFTAGAHWAKL